MILRMLSAAMVLFAAPVEQYTLPNGMVVVLEVDRSTPWVAVSVTVNAGSKNDPQGQEGLAHLVEHLMFSRALHTEESPGYTNFRSGSLRSNGTTSVDFTRYFETVPREHLQTILWMESDRMGFQDMRFVSSLDVEKERRTIGNEYWERRESNLGISVFEDLKRRTFPKNHHYQRGGFAGRTDSEPLTLEHIRRFVRDHYRPNNMVLSLVGDLPNETRAWVDKYFATIPKAEGEATSSPTPPSSTQTDPAFDTVLPETVFAAGGAATAVYWSWPVAVLDAQEDAVGDVLAALVPMLNHRVNQQLSATVVLDAAYTEYVEGGMFYLRATCWYDRNCEATHALEIAHQTLADSSVSDALVLRASNVVRLEREMWRESIEGRAEWNARAALTGETLVDSVTPTHEVLRQFVSTHLRGESKSILRIEAAR